MGLCEQACACVSVRARACTNQRVACVCECVCECECAPGLELVWQECQLRLRRSHSPFCARTLSTPVPQLRVQLTGPRSPVLLVPGGASQSSSQSWLAPPWPQVTAWGRSSLLVSGVYFPALTSLLSQKVRESERAFTYSAVGAGSQFG